MPLHKSQSIKIFDDFRCHRQKCQDCDKSCIVHLFCASLPSSIDIFVRNPPRSGERFVEVLVILEAEFQWLIQRLPFFEKEYSYDFGSKQNGPTF